VGGMVGMERSILPILAGEEFGIASRTAAVSFSYTGTQELPFCSKGAQNLASWQDLSDSAPEFAARVKALFEARVHKVLATLRRDGSPRLSGIEVTFADGDIWIGSMPESRKSQDFARDPRLAILVSSADPPPDNPGSWPGDARISGVVQLVDDPSRLQSMSGGSAAEQRSEDDVQDAGILYRIDITEAVLTSVALTNDHLIIESWTPARGYRKITRQ
jgi:hypothetical protein